MFITELYRQVTSHIIMQMEQGALPWLRPWKTRPGVCTGLMPQNYTTGRGYHGINIPILWDAAATHGYDTHSWLTYKQAEAVKAQVRKGERGTHVVFTKKLRVAKKEKPEESKTVSMLRTFTVFNIAQINGLPTIPSNEVPIEEPPDKRYAKVQDFVSATGATINYGGDTACFVPSLDFINLPLKMMFKTSESFYATTLHEGAHWSGHKTRLDRDLSGRFGTRAYAAEEMIAEFTSAFLCAHLGIEGELRHAGYIEHWLDLLKHDDRAVFTAASKASQATDYLRSFSESAEEQEAA